MSITGLIIWIIVGAISGLLAETVVHGFGYGLIGAILVGIVGGLIGGWLFSLLGIGIGIGILGDIFVSFIGAVMLLLIARALRVRWA